MSSISSLTSTSSSATRITGLISGLDTDTIVEQLMAVERKPLERLQQKQQLAEWRMEAYREITNALRTFNDKYFNYANSSTNMLSQSTYKKFAVTSSDESVVSVSANSEAAEGTHTIIVSNLATAAVYKSASGVTGDVTGTTTADFSAASGKSFVLNLDGDKTTITIDESITDIGSLQDAIDEAVGSGKVEVSDTNGDGTGYLVFKPVSGSGVANLTISDGTDSALSSLGFSGDASLSSRLATSDTLETIAGKIKNAFTFDAEGKVTFSINGASFAFDKSTTLKQMMNEINSSSDAGVTMKYNEISDKFEITADNTGAGNKIRLSESGSTFLESAGITDYTEGEDAVVILDGEKITRSTNSIKADGVTYKLLKESSVEQTISLSLDTDAIYDQITAFVNDYNQLIDTLNDRISEEYDRDYPPLTDAQKDEMTEDEIKAWEKKAKTGLLQNDSILRDALDSMRSALYESVSGVSVNLSKIGITTSSSYEDNGKLEIDADQLKEAIESNPDEVMALFSKESETYSGTTGVRSLNAGARTVRSSEEGLAYRLYDIIQDNISTYRDSNGNKGLLLQKAGQEGDASEYSNTLYSQISDYDEAIETMLDKLDEKEDRYYAKFSAMEAYINNMNAQITALQSYLS